MGPIENNVYLISDGETTFVVDPTCHAERIMNALDGRAVDSIVLTHAHWDHVGAAKALRDATGARVIASTKDAPVISGKKKLDASHRPFEPCPIDLEVSDGDTVHIGAMQWSVMLTPGHTPGSMCLLLETDGAGQVDADQASSGQEPILISGDTLFAGAHGRTDFVGGSPADMRASLARLAELPDNTVVLPGHNDPTTIGREKRWMTR